MFTSFGFPNTFGLTQLATTKFSCSICGTDVENIDQNDSLIECDFCGCTVHQSCYNVKHIPIGPWYCLYCSQIYQMQQQGNNCNYNQLPQCIICKQNDTIKQESSNLNAIAMAQCKIVKTQSKCQSKSKSKSTLYGWTHVICGNSFPNCNKIISNGNLTFEMSNKHYKHLFNTNKDNDNSKSESKEKSKSIHRRKTCVVCNSDDGYLIQCSHYRNNCKESIHPSCARNICNNIDSNCCYFDSLIISFDSYNNNNEIKEEETNKECYYYFCKLHRPILNSANNNGNNYFSYANYVSPFDNTTKKINKLKEIAKQLIILKFNKDNTSNNKDSIKNRRSKTSKTSSKIKSRIKSDKYEKSSRNDKERNDTSRRRQRISKTTKPKTKAQSKIASTTKAEKSKSKYNTQREQKHKHKHKRRREYDSSESEIENRESSLIDSNNDSNDGDTNRNNWKKKNKSKTRATKAHKTSQESQQSQPPSKRRRVSHIVKNNNRKQRNSQESESSGNYRTIGENSQEISASFGKLDLNVDTYDSPTTVKSPAVESFVNNNDDDENDDENKNEFGFGTEANIGTDGIYDEGYFGLLNESSDNDDSTSSASPYIPSPSGLSRAEKRRLKNSRFLLNEFDSDYDSFDSNDSRKRAKKIEKLENMAVLTRNSKKLLNKLHTKQYESKKQTPKRLNYSNSMMENGNGNASQSNVNINIDGISFEGEGEAAAGGSYFGSRVMSSDDLDSDIDSFSDSEDSDDDEYDSQSKITNSEIDYYTTNDGSSSSSASESRSGSGTSSGTGSGSGDSGQEDNNMGRLLTTPQSVKRQISKTDPRGNHRRTKLEERYKNLERKVNVTVEGARKVEGQGKTRIRPARKAAIKRRLELSGMDVSDINVNDLFDNASEIEIESKNKNKRQGKRGRKPKAKVESMSENESRRKEKEEDDKLISEPPLLSIVEKPKRKRGRPRIKNSDKNDAITTGIIRKRRRRKKRKSHKSECIANYHSFPYCMNKCSYKDREWNIGDKKSSKSMLNVNSIWYCKSSMISNYGDKKGINNRLFEFVASHCKNVEIEKDYPKTTLSLNIGHNDTNNNDNSNNKSGKNDNNKCNLSCHRLEPFSSVVFYNDDIDIDIDTVAVGANMNDNTKDNSLQAGTHMSPNLNPKSSVGIKNKNRYSGDGSTLMKDGCIRDIYINVGGTVMAMDVIDVGISEMSDRNNMNESCYANCYYLCVACDDKNKYHRGSSFDEDDNFSDVDICGFQKSLIQMWKILKMECKNDKKDKNGNGWYKKGDLINDGRDRDVSLNYAIVHKYGFVWDLQFLKWPGLNTKYKHDKSMNNNTSKNKNKSQNTICDRIGILAVCSSDNNVHIYSLPVINNNNNNNNNNNRSNKIINLAPIFKLSVHGQTVCRVKWSPIPVINDFDTCTGSNNNDNRKTNKQNERLLLLGGTLQGSIILWDFDNLLNCIDYTFNDGYSYNNNNNNNICGTLLFKDCQLSLITGHNSNSCIFGIDWCDDNDLYFVSMSMNGDFRLWNINNLHIPIVSRKYHGTMFDLKWIPGIDACLVTCESYAPTYSNPTVIASRQQKEKKIDKNNRNQIQQKVNTSKNQTDCCVKLISIWPHQCLAQNSNNRHWNAKPRRSHLNINTNTMMEGNGKGKRKEMTSDEIGKIYQENEKQNELNVNRNVKNSENCKRSKSHFKKLGPMVQLPSERLFSTSDRWAMTCDILIDFDKNFDNRFNNVNMNININNTIDATSNSNNNKDKNVKNDSVSSSTSSKINLNHHFLNICVGYSSGSVIYHKYDLRQFVLQKGICSESRILSQLFLPQTNFNENKFLQMKKYFDNQYSKIEDKELNVFDFEFNGVNGVNHELYNNGDSNDSMNVKKKNNHNDKDKVRLQFGGPFYGVSSGANRGQAEKTRQYWSKKGNVKEIINHCNGKNNVKQQKSVNGEEEYDDNDNDDGGDDENEMKLPIFDSYSISPIELALDKTVAINKVKMYSYFSKCASNNNNNNNKQDNSKNKKNSQINSKQIHGKANGKGKQKTQRKRKRKANKRIKIKSGKKEIDDDTTEEDETDSEEEEEDDDSDINSTSNESDEDDNSQLESVGQSDVVEMKNDCGDVIDQDKKKNANIVTNERGGDRHVRLLDVANGGISGIIRIQTMLHELQ